MTAAPAMMSGAGPLSLGPSGTAFGAGVAFALVAGEATATGAALVGAAVGVAAAVAQQERPS